MIGYNHSNKTAKEQKKPKGETTMKGNKQQLLKAAVEYYRFLNTIIEDGDAQAAYKLEDGFRTQIEIASDGLLVIGQIGDSGKFTSLRVYERHEYASFATVEI